MIALIVTAIMCTVIGYGAGLLIRTLPTPPLFRGTRGRHTAR